MKSRYFEMIQWSILQLIMSLLLILIYYLLSRKVNKKKTLQWFDIVIIIILVSISGLRCNVGSDYYNYYLQYKNVLIWHKNIFSIFKERFQNGYILIAYLTQKFIGGQASIFIITAIIMYTSLIVKIKENSKYPWQSFAIWILLGYFSMSMNIIKQYLAMIFVLFAFDSFYRKKYMKYIIYCIFSCFFHLSSIYCLLCIPIANIVKDTKKLYRYFIVGGIIIFLGIKYILIRILFMFPQKYYGYIYALINGDFDKKLQIGGIFVSIFYIFFMKLLITKTKKLDNKYYRSSLNIAICMIPFLMISIQQYIFNRVAYFGVQMLIFIIPSVLNKNKVQKIIFILFFILYSLVFSIVCAENNYYNYSTIFNTEPMSVLEYVRKNMH